MKVLLQEACRPCRNQSIHNLSQGVPHPVLSRKLPWTSGSIMGWRWGTPQKGHGTSGSIMGWKWSTPFGYEQTENITFPHPSDAGGNKGGSTYLPASSYIILQCAGDRYSNQLSYCLLTFHLKQISGSENFTRWLVPSPRSLAPYDVAYSAVHDAVHGTIHDPIHGTIYSTIHDTIYVAPYMTLYTALYMMPYKAHKFRGVYSAGVWSCIWHRTLESYMAQDLGAVCGTGLWSCMAP